MTNLQPATEYKSAERLAFEHYLRTGQRLSAEAWREKVEHKFNPYHDPRDGRFTFAPGSPRSLSHIVISDRRRVHRNQQQDSGMASTVEAEASSAPHRPAHTDSISDAVYRPGESSATVQLAQYRPNSRSRIGGNGGPPLNDPMTLERAFPGLTNAPGGSLVALADNILDLSGPMNRLTTGLTEAYANILIRQISAIDPNYRLDTLGFPTTLDGQISFVRQLRLDRATAFYRVKGETRPLQVETLRLMQERTDSVYIEGQALFEAGRLRPRLSREEAIGNYVDRAVRRELRNMYNVQDIDYSKGQQVRVIGREYDTSGSDRTYRIPDARVGNIAFDVTLTRKTLATPQVQGFFSSDSKPDAVVIIGPKQLGPNSSYAIARARK